MKCPVDNADLLMTDRNGVEIDYCPKCRGIWLDRGELDKLIERAAQMETPATASPLPRDNRAPARFDDDDDSYEYKRKNDAGYQGDDRSYPQGRKKKSFLGDMFDIFD